MTTYTYTSSERGVESDGSAYAPCCGQSPVVLTWRRKGLVAIACVSPDCPNHEGVLCFPKEAASRWATFRRPTPVEQRAALMRGAPVLEHAGAVCWDGCPWCEGK